ncbi:MAG TPA: MFS transporter [Candidatus Dormibacteraeota bacterium]|nr:MFS transporter [Candidatus Dormibacteraeota bacterium]
MPPRVRSAVAYVVVYTAVGSYVPYLPLYYRSLGLGLGQIGAILALGAFVGLLAAPLWGALSDRLRGSPRVLISGVAVAIVGAVILALSPASWLTFLGASCFGAGLAGTIPILDARALEAAGANRSSYGPLRAWGSMSYVVSAVATGAAIEAWGIRVLFIVLIVSLLATALVGLSLRSPARRGVDLVVNPLLNAGRLFGPRGLGLFLLGAFLSWLAMSAVLTFTPLRFAQLGAGATIVGLGGAIAASIEVPIMLGFPRLAMRFGSERLLIAGVVFIAARAVVAELATEPTLLLAASVFGGVGFALFFVGGVTYVSRRVPPELAATAQGIFQGLANSLSQVTAALAGGAVAAAFGIQGLFGVSIVLGVLGAAILGFAVRARAT